MLRCAVNHLGRSRFDNLASPQDNDLVADVFHDRKVVRNEQISDPQFLLQICEQVDNLGLHADIKCADRFVAHDQRRFCCEGARDPDALALTPAEFVWKPPEKFGLQADSLAGVPLPCFPAEKH